MYSDRSEKKISLWASACRLAACVRQADDAARTRWAYIAEAAVEYFIAIVTSGAFLTLLLKQMGASDALTGIISSFTVLAYGVQMFTVTFIRRRRSIRRSVLVLQTLQQLMYSLVYLLPFLPLANGAKVVMFMVLFLSATLLSNLVTPVKYNWMMHFVRPENRGIFTAHKEMVSLITGLVYNYVMSLAIDRLEAVGRPDLGLILCAAVVFVLTAVHVATLLAAKDAPAVLEETRKAAPLMASLKASFANPTFLKLLAMSCAWGMLYWVSSAYYSLFMLQEVGSSVTYIATVNVVSCLARVFISPRMGRICDRQGFARGMCLGYILAGAAFFLLIFWRPENGKVLYLANAVLLAMAFSAINGGQSNILLAHIPARDRVGSLGLYTALIGVAGFAGSVIGGWILSAVQGAGNRVLGMDLYGQQILSLISFLCVIVLIVYNIRVVQKLKPVEE